MEPSCLSYVCVAETIIPERKKNGKLRNDLLLLISEASLCQGNHERK